MFLVLIINVHVFPIDISKLYSTCLIFRNSIPELHEKGEAFPTTIIILLLHLVGSVICQQREISIFIMMFCLFFLHFPCRYCQSFICSGSCTMRGAHGITIPLISQGISNSLLSVRMTLYPTPALPFYSRSCGPFQPIFLSFSFIF